MLNAHEYAYSIAMRNTTHIVLYMYDGYMHLQKQETEKQNHLALAMLPIFLKEWNRPCAHLLHYLSNQICEHMFLKLKCTLQCHIKVRIQ